MSTLPTELRRKLESAIGKAEDTGGARHTAEVMAPGREPHWRWSDPGRSCYRIHTKHLTTEPL